MASPKRQRQEQMRALRRQELEQQQHKQKRTAKAKRYGIIGAIVVVIVGFVLWSSRGGDDDTTPVTTSVAPSTTAGPSTTEGPTTTAPPNTIAGLGDKPAVTVPDGVPPAELQTTDLVVGTGKEAVNGSAISVQYVGVSWSTKKQFDASWDNGKQPFSLTLGKGQVIQGWEKGLVGMKVGGRRQIVIPPALGYGDSGAGSDIKPGETLVFVVDLLSVS